MEVNTKTENSYVILTSNFEYNDEIYYSEGYRLDHTTSYPTQQEAKNKARELIVKDFGTMRIFDFWYQGDEPLEVTNFVQTTHGAVDYWDVTSTILDFVQWCDNLDIDPLDTLDFYNIVEIEPF